MASKQLVQELVPVGLERSAHIKNFSSPSRDLGQCSGVGKHEMTDQLGDPWREKEVFLN